MKFLSLSAAIMMLFFQGERPGVASASVASRRDIDSMVALFYRERDGRPAWGDANQWSGNAGDLVDALNRAQDDGLDPRLYDAARLAAGIRSAPQPTSAARIDSALTRAFLTFASDLSQGRVHPPAYRQWRDTPKTLDLVGLLNASLANGAIARALGGTAPSHPGYRALRRLLARYRQLADAGGWPPFPEGFTLRPGAIDPRVPALRERLSLEGFSRPSTDSAAQFFDAELEQTLREYQEDRGLTPDGILGPATVRTLNVTAESRVAQIAANLERWRWLPASLDQPYVMVNVAGFSLDLVTPDSTTFRSRVVIGRKDWPTPIVSSSITDLVFRPTWSVPRGIAAKELLAVIKRNPSYLQKQQIKVFRGVDEVDPAAIDWKSVSRWNLPYRFVQEPGPDNPLGTVKFLFQTPFGVYLHDTPTRSAFAKDQRYLSHGCVRVERAAELAARLRGWPADSTNAGTETGRNYRVPLAQPIPVHLVYWTAWVDSAGAAQFRPDGYGWDTRVIVASGLQESRVELAEAATTIAAEVGCRD